MYNARNGSLSSPVYSRNYVVWERSFIIAAVILTVVGFSLLEGILGNVGDRVLARVGSTTYLFGGVLVVASEAIELSSGEELRSLIAIYVILAFLAQAAIGGALLRTRLCYTDGLDGQLLSGIGGG